MKIIRGLEQLSYEDRMRELDEEEQAAGVPWSNLLCLKWACKKAGKHLFPRVCSDKTRAMALNLKRVYLDRKKFLRVERCWNRLLREVVAIPSLEVLMARLDGIFSPGLVKGIPAHGQVFGTGWLLRSLLTLTISRFCDFHSCLFVDFQIVVGKAPFCRSLPDSCV